MFDPNQRWEWDVPDDEIEDKMELTPTEEWEEEVKFWGYQSRWPGKIGTKEKMMDTMNKSATLAKLSAALSKAQGELNPAKKTGANPFYKSKYATLEGVWDACREALSANELAVIQCPQVREESVCLETILTHSSGEWISSLIPLMLTKQDPQTMGSALSYARRYALAAMIGIVQSDDDGEKAMQPVRTKTEDVKPISIKEMKTLISKKITLEKPEYLESYLAFCKERTPKPMREVIEGWVQNPEPFMKHYANWVSKKKLDNVVEVHKNGEQQPSLLEDQAL